MSVIKNHFNSKKLDVPFCAWKLQGNEANEIVEINLQPREFIDTHINPLPVFFYVLSGSGALTIDGTTYLLGEHDSIFVEKGLNRKWENNGESVMQILLIKQLN